ncbi:hypothetical protein ACN28S_67630 [Cystobacter fuscus]
MPLTHTLAVEQNLSQSLLKELQFYTSNTITLKRMTKSGERQATPSARLLIINGEQYETIEIPADTPCVVTWAAHDMSWIDVRFEEGENYLRFVSLSQSKAADAE